MIEEILDIGVTNDEPPGLESLPEVRKCRCIIFECENVVVRPKILSSNLYQHIIMCFVVCASF